MVLFFIYFCVFGWICYLCFVQSSYPPQLAVPITITTSELRCARTLKGHTDIPHLRPSKKWQPPFVMEIPIPHRARAPPALPEIYVQDSNPSDRFRMYSKSTTYNSTSSPANIPGPMSIPNARAPVPPPLPPPRHIADIGDGGHNGPDIAWQWGNSHEDNGWGKSVAPGSSLYGGFPSERSSQDVHRDYSRRTTSSSTIKAVLGPDSRESHYPRIDEGYASLPGTSVGSNRLVISLYCTKPSGWNSVSLL